MILLTIETTQKCYDDLYNCHNDKRTFRLRVRDFQHNMEHIILSEITKRNNFYDVYDPNDKDMPRFQQRVIEEGQLSWLTGRQKRWYRNTENEFIPPILVSGIQFLKANRIVAEHSEEVDPIDSDTYKALFRIMIKVINFFSGQPVPEKLQNILDNRKEKESLDNKDINETDSNLHFNPIITERIKRKIEDGLEITKGTVPILYFGNYNSAKACTISFNPSNKEFLDDNGKFLSDENKRFCNRKELGKKDNEELSDDDVKKILEYYNNYFLRNPYPFFNRLESLISLFDYSYKKNCVNFNMVQWATDKFWTDLSKNLQNIHLTNDLQILEILLNDNRNIEKVFLNGDKVVSEFECCFNIGFDIYDTEKSFMAGPHKKVLKIYTGKYLGMEIIGWNIFLGKLPTLTDDDSKIICKTIFEFVNKKIKNQD
jgi:hypothetical protein